MIILHVTADTNFGGVQQCILGICQYAAVQGSPFEHHILRVGGGGLEKRFAKYSKLHDAGPNFGNAVSLIRSIKPDLIHMHLPGGDFPPYAEQIAQTGVPIIESIHCVNAATAREEELMRIRIVGSQYVYSLQQCKERLHIIPYALDEEDWSELQGKQVQDRLREVREKELGIDRETLVVGRIGNIMPWKRVTDFVHAIPPILRSALSGTPPAFLLAGAVHENPAYAASVIRTAKMLFVEDKIRFFWNIPRKFLFLGMLDIFLYPTSREGYCIAAIEAMSMGLPVITYEDSAMPETVSSEAGILVKKGDIEGLSRAVLSLLENPRLLKAKSDAARELVKQRNMPNKVFCHYEKLYEQCN